MWPFQKFEKSFIVRNENFLIVFSKETVEISASPKKHVKKKKKNTSNKNISKKNTFI